MTTQTTSAGLPGFTQADFNVFLLQGLEERMSAIQNQIQPKFRALGEQLSVDLSVHAGNEMHLHVARHARRKVNPPKDTWLAICSNKRGYKAHPHFQLGLFDDHLFLWLALIYEVPNKSGIAAAFLNQIDDVIAAVPGDYVLSLDHMKKDSTVVGEMSRKDWTDALVRFRDVQKAELLIGRHVQAGDALLRDGDALLEFASSTYETLMPLYRMANV
ncbi:YktB family protein [Paenibacillus sp. sgz302251]|uniref:YktB family protein n=1 Tax=Paenibacillus sp. sgz302251 TaxID=3414493 RepID=UPI003C7D2577